jgi:hypothetical protein
VVQDDARRCGFVNLGFHEADNFLNSRSSIKFSRKNLVSFSYLITDKIASSLTFAGDGSQPALLTAEQAETRGLCV